MHPQISPRLLDSGYTPRDLCKALGFDLPEDLPKDDAAQPRDGQGRWTSGGGSAPAAQGGSAAPLAEDRRVGINAPGQSASTVAANEKDKDYERRQKRGTETPKEDLEHGNGISLPQLPPFEPEYPLPRTKFGDEVNIPGLPANIKARDATSSGARHRDYNCDLTQSGFES